MTASLTDAEIQTRRDLAALYRLVAHFRMTDLIDTHITRARRTTSSSTATACCSTRCGRKTW